MQSFVLSLIIALIIAGFILWAGRKVLALAPIDATIKSWIDLLIVIAVAAIVIFYIVIPLIQMLGRLSIPGLH